MMNANVQTGSSSTLQLDSSVIESLMGPGAYPHPVKTIELIETHISWVILTGQFAYKIKKPIKLDFLDFRKLSSRLFYCEEELRLNQPWAPEIYLDVVAISLETGKPRISAQGEPVEYAVRMRQFDQKARLDAQLDSDILSMDDMSKLADIVATRHQSTPRIGPEGNEENISLIYDFMAENFASLKGHVPERKRKILRQWTIDALNTHQSDMRRRFEELPHGQIDDLEIASDSSIFWE